MAHDVDGDALQRVRKGLEGFLSARLPEAEDLRVGALEIATEGFSQETFVFEASYRQGGAAATKGYVAKREPVAGLLEPYDLEPEFRVLHALSQDPLPSPPTPWFEPDPSVLERPFYVMERLPGRVPIPAPRADGRPPFSDAERRILGPQVAEALAELHAVDWRKRDLEFLGPPEDPSRVALRELERWEARMARSELSLPPVIGEALGWLRRHAPAAREIALVHGDYRLGNWLVSEEAQGPRLTGLVDWEMVHLGDPLEDLAWCSCPLWRAGTPWAAALLPPDELRALYERAAGRAVDPEALHWYELFATLKMLAIQCTGIRAFRDGRTRDLRMAIFDHQLPFLCALLAVQRGFLQAPEAA